MAEKGEKVKGRVRAMLSFGLIGEVIFGLIFTIYFFSGSGSGFFIWIIAGVCTFIGLWQFCQALQRGRKFVKIFFLIAYAASFVMRILSINYYGTMGAVAAGSPLAVFLATYYILDLLPVLVLFGMLWRRDHFIKLGFITRLIIRLALLVPLVTSSGGFPIDAVYIGLIQIVSSLVNSLVWVKFIRRPTIFLTIVPTMSKPKVAKGEKIRPEHLELEKRKATLRNIVNIYEEIPIAKLAKLLDYPGTDTTELEKWLLSLQENFQLKIAGEIVHFDIGLTQDINNLLSSFADWEKTGYAKKV